MFCHFGILDKACQVAKVAFVRARSHSRRIRLSVLRILDRVPPVSPRQNRYLLLKLIISLHILLLSTLDHAPLVSPRRNAYFSKKWSFCPTKRWCPDCDFCCRKFLLIKHRCFVTLESLIKLVKWPKWRLCVPARILAASV